MQTKPIQRIVKNRQQEVEPSAGNLTTIHENTSTEPLATPTLSTFNDPLQANGVAATAGKEPGGIQENAAVDSLTVTQYLSSSAHPLSKAQSDGQKDQTMTGYTGTLVDQTLLSQGEKPL